MILYSATNRALISFTDEVLPGAQNLIIADSSNIVHSLMSASVLTLSFSSPSAIDIGLGAYIEIEGIRYTLYYTEAVKKIHDRHYDYTLTMHTRIEEAKHVLVKDRNNPPRIKFPLTATAQSHLDLLLKSFNEGKPSSKRLYAGEVIDAKPRLISYNAESVYSALSRICNEFKTEWELVGNVINIKKVEYNKTSPLSLQYGKGNGFLSGIARQNNSDKKPISRLYVVGGERNIDPSKYKSRALRLPFSQTLIYNGKPYKTDWQGLYIQRTDIQIEGQESSLDVSHIYPERQGTVTRVDVVDAAKNFYDIIDNTIPEALNYNDYRIPGQKATIKFETGILAGREFDVQQTENSLIGYVHNDRRFKLVPREEDGVVMPGGNFVPAVGDKYAVFNIALPDAYICDNASKTGASWEMFREAVRYLADNETPEFSFHGKIDGIWAKTNWLAVGAKLTVGNYVEFSDRQFHPAGTIVRITSMKQIVNSPHTPDITLSSAPGGGTFSSVIDKIEAEEVTRNEQRREDRNYTARLYQQAIETSKALVGAVAGFDKAISPISVNVMQLIAGAKELQFKFVLSTTSTETAPHPVSFDKATSQLKVKSAVLRHMTLDIKSISSVRSLSDFRHWSVQSYTSPSLDASKLYYLYIKAAKVGTSATAVMSESIIPLESVSGYYHLLVGILNPEAAGERSFAILHGFAELLPGQLTVDRIVSGNGQSFIDLERNETKIGNENTYMHFDPTSGALKVKGAIVTVGSEEMSLEDALNQAAQPGKDGAYTIFQYAKNNSETTPPIDGWSSAVPTLAQGEQLWMRSGVVQPPRTAPESWSTPVRLTGNKGLDGSPGVGIPGASVVFAYKQSYAKPSRPVQSEEERTTQPIPAGWLATPEQPAVEGMSVGISNIEYIGDWAVVQSGDKKGYRKAPATADNSVSIARINFRASAGAKLVIKIAVSSETNYDYLCLSHLNQLLEKRADYNDSSKTHKKISGVDSATVTIDIPQATESGFVTLMYTKDGSGQRNEDTGWFKVEEPAGGYWWQTSSTMTRGENGTYRMGDWSPVVGYALDRKKLEEISEAYGTSKLFSKTFAGGSGLWSVISKGGAMLLTMLGLGNSKDGLRSGVSGHPDEPSAFFAGVTNFGEENEYRQIDIRHDGTADIGLTRFSKDGAIEFRDKRTESPYMRIGGSGKALQDVLNGNNKTQTGSLQGINLQYLPGSNDPQVQFLPGSLSVELDGSEMRIKANVSISLQLYQMENATGVSVAQLELYRDGELYSQIDYASIILSYNPNPSWDSGLNPESALEGGTTSGYDGSDWHGSVQHNVDIRLPSVSKGVYTVRVRYSTLGTNIQEGTLVISNPFIQAKWESSTSEIGMAKGRFFVVRGSTIFHMDADTGLTVRGKVDMPGYLGGGRVDAQGQMPFRDGKIVSCEKSFTSYNHSHKYKIHHSIGHTNYSVSVLPIGNERMFPRLREYTSSYFVVDFFHAPEEEYEKTWPTGFTFTVHGSNA